MSLTDIPPGSPRSQPTAAVGPPVEIPLSASTKVKPQHLSRLAIVYIRQSTQQQVINNRE